MLPETELVQICARPAMNDATASRLKTVAASVTDWGLALRQANRHRTVPLLHSHLHTHCTADVAPQVMDSLRDQVLANAARCALMTARMLDIIGIFEEHGVRALPFKGPVLSVMAYGDPSLRQFDDLDFLVHPEDIRKAKRLLVEMGCVPAIDLSPAGEEALFRGAWGCGLHEPDGHYWIEINSATVPRYFRFALDPESALRESQQVMIDNRTVSTLSAEHLLLALCVHGTWHAWERLQWVSDVSALLGSVRIDEARVAMLASSLGVRRILALGLQLARDILVTEIPEALIDVDEGAGRRVEQSRKRLAGEGSHTLSQRELMRFHLRSRERPGDRLGYILLLLLLPGYSDWTSMRLPRPLFPVYGVIRPFRLLGRLVLRTRGRTGNSRQDQQD